MTADGVVATIDEALADWATSGDAMRWTPDSRKITDDWPRSGRFAVIWLRVDTSEFQRSMRQLTETFKRFEPHFHRLVEAMARASSTADWERHHPPALRIDGAEYSRRRRARQRRRR